MYRIEADMYRNLRPEEKDEILERVDNSETPAQIAKAMGLAPSLVKHNLLEARCTLTATQRTRLLEQVIEGTPPTEAAREHGVSLPYVTALIDRAVVALLAAQPRPLTPVSEPTDLQLALIRQGLHRGQSRTELARRFNLPWRVIDNA